MKKVYVTQFNPNLQYGKAKIYGEIVFLTEYDLTTEPCAQGHNDRLIKQVEGKLVKYNPGYDYILLAGSPAIILLVGTLLDNDVDHQILRWDNRTYEYRVTTLNLSKGAIDNDTSRISSVVHQSPR